MKKKSSITLNDDLSLTLNSKQQKELVCINQVTDVLNQHKPIEQALQEICFILPNALEFPEFVIIRITFEGMEYVYPKEFANMSHQMLKVKWTLRQIFATKNSSGMIELFYIKEFSETDKELILVDEKNIVKNVSKLISNFLNTNTYSQNEAINKKQVIEPLEDQPKANNLKINSRQLLQNFLNRNNYDRDLYHDLMPFKVKEILLVANLYDAFSIEKEGRFSEYILGKYHQLNLISLPRITGASSYEEALLQLNSKHYDLIILMMGTDKDTPIKLSEKLKNEFAYIPIFLLLNNDKDISLFEKAHAKFPAIDKIFVWNGDSSIFFAMIKLLEDLINSENDTRLGSVRVILLVEDSAKYYSRYLPLIYTSVMEQTKRIIDDASTDELYRLLRLRVRPKILLASNYEEAISIFNKYKDYLLCLITDVKFNRNGIHVNAGFSLVKEIRQQISDLPTVVQSFNIENKLKAEQLNTIFINKNSESLLQDIKTFISFNLGFGDFKFRDQYGNHVAIAKTLDEFVTKLNSISVDSLIFHSSRNHFSLWLMARGEIEIAKILSPYKIQDFITPNEVRKHIITLIKQHRRERNKGKVVDFGEYEVFEEINIASLASGSLGGKGRGLAFINTLLYNLDFSKYIPGIRIRAPRTAIVGVDEFDMFLDNNDLHQCVYDKNKNKNIQEIFMNSKLSNELISKLRKLLQLTNKPLAIRSSGLFEDSLMQPFAGVFATYLLPNNHPVFEQRLQQVMNAIKLVFASVFSNVSRNYINAIDYKIEQEKMAVIIQEAIGNYYTDEYGSQYFYPHFSGTAQSYNYYPVANMKPEEGFAVIAVGFGLYVVQGEKAFRFSPKYPDVEINTPKNLFQNSQVDFYCLDMNKKEVNLLEGEESTLAKLDIYEAEQHGTIKHCASVYDPDNDRIDAGLSASGPRIINFADILKYDFIPLAKGLEVLLDVIKEAMGAPVEIEFAVDLNKDKNGLASFYLLQIKPLVGNKQDYNIDTDEIDESKVLVYSENSMGNGKINDVRDVIFVDNDKFDKMKTQEMAREIEILNAEMVKEKRGYVLIGPGRWGTRDKFIGIPVNWTQISNAKMIIETSMVNFPLDASLGSHFFHNVTSMNVGYLSIKNNSQSDYIVWDTLKKEKIKKRTKFFKHIRYKQPLDIVMDGKKRIAVVQIKK